MGKNEFLKFFQKNLRDSLDRLLREEWGLEDLLVTEEDGDLPGKFTGYMDISIYNPYNIYSVIGIEIEHISEYPQARRNIAKLKAWTHNSYKRTSGLLHIINEDCRISPENFSEMVAYAKENEHKN